MKLIKQSFEIIPQENTLEGLYKHIEKCSRTCYKSEDKITEASAKPFVDRLIKSQHTAMLEHATVYLTVPIKEALDYAVKLFNLEDDPYTKTEVSRDKVNITTNLRVIVENGWEELLKFISKPTEYHYKRVTVKFVTDQGILREFTRHKLFCVA